MFFKPKEAIDAVDGDGSGFVDIDEFIELMRIKSKEAADEAEIKEAFRILDRDNKGGNPTSWPNLCKQWSPVLFNLLWRGNGWD